MSLLIQTILLIMVVFAGIGIYYKMLKNPLYSLKYKHPDHAIGVGPVWTETQGPPINYMYVWRDAKRLHMEFRNLPGIIISADDCVIKELSEALRSL